MYKEKKTIVPLVTTYYSVLKNKDFLNYLYYNENLCRYSNETDVFTVSIMDRTDKILNKRNGKT